MRLRALQHGIEIVLKRFVAEVGADIQQLHGVGRGSKEGIVPDDGDEWPTWRKPAGFRTTPTQFPLCHGQEKAEDPHAAFCLCRHQAERLSGADSAQEESAPHRMNIESTMQQGDQAPLWLGCFEVSHTN
ncbi:MAG TPA: hypothetical protein VIM06_06030 [Rhodanobacter sp.]